MELSKLFKSVLEQDTASVVLCDLNHTIVYMNPASIHNYKKDLTGSSLLACHNEQSNIMIKKVVEWFGKDKGNNIVHTFFNQKQNKDVYMVALRDDDGTLIGYYEKHEFRNKDESALYQMN